MRVGAIMDADGVEVRLFGFGIYDGDEVPPETIKMFGAPVRHRNPKIVLDNGKVVWGCECWWAPEEKIKKMIGNRIVKEVDIEEMRQR